MSRRKPPVGSASAGFGAAFFQRHASDSALKTSASGLSSNGSGRTSIDSTPPVPLAQDTNEIPQAQIPVSLRGTCPPSPPPRSTSLRLPAQPLLRDFLGAVRTGDLGGVKWMLSQEKPVDVNAQDDGGWTALHWAVYKNYPKIATFLAQQGCDPYIRNSKGQTAIDRAPKSLADAILRASFLSQRQREVEKHLVPPPTKPPVVHMSNACAALLKAAQNNDVPGLAAAINAGADVNAVCDKKDGSCVLHSAVSRKNLEAVEFLVDNGADVHATNVHGLTSLHLAAMSRHRRMCLFLVSRGADITATNDQGRTVLDLCPEATLRISLQEAHDRLLREEMTVQLGQSEFRQALEGNDLARIAQVVRRVPGISIREKNTRTGRTALHYAANGGDDELVEILCQQGAGPNEVDQRGSTPLHLATQQGFLKTCVALITNGAEPNSVDRNFHTPLHYAVVEGFDTIARYLTSNGASLTVLDEMSKSPLDYATVHVKHDLQDVAAMRFTRLQTSDGADMCDPLSLSALPVEWNTYSSELPLLAHRGDLSGLRMALKGGESVDSIDVDSQTALHRAAFKGHTTTLQLLMDHGANLNLRDAYGCTALHRAAFRGHVEAARSLVRAGAQPSVKDKDGMTPLHLASDGGYGDLARVLVEAGADAFVVDRRGNAPLAKLPRDIRAELEDMATERQQQQQQQRTGEVSDDVVRAIQKGDISLLSKCLRQLDVSVNYQDESGWSILHLAAYQGSLAVASRILDSEANVNVQDVDGWTPLHRAVEMRNLDMVGLLLQRGADVNISDHWGRTPTQLARELHFDEIVGYLVEHGGYKELVEPAISSNHDSSPSTPINETAPSSSSSSKPLRHEKVTNLMKLFHAIDEGNEVLALSLIPTVDVNVCDDSGRAPLHRAVWKGLVRVVEVLLKRGAHIEKQDNHGYRALHLASSQGNIQMTQSLLNSFAIVTATDAKGRTPLHHAVMNGRTRVALLLVECGAPLAVVDLEHKSPLDYAPESQRAILVDASIRFAAKRRAS